MEKYAYFSSDFIDFITDHSKLYHTKKQLRVGHMEEKMEVFLIRACYILYIVSAASLLYFGAKILKGATTSITSEVIVISSMAVSLSLSGLEKISFASHSVKSSMSLLMENPSFMTEPPHDRLYNV